MCALVFRIGDVAGGGDKCVKAGTCVSSSATGGKAWPVENYDAMHKLPGMVSALFFGTDFQEK